MVGFANYEELSRALLALTRDVPYETANLANAAALLWQAMEDINWVGFYKMEDGALILGPFQGKPACVRIAPGKGVCGTAAREKKAMAPRAALQSRKKSAHGQGAATAAPRHEQRQ